MVSRGGKNTVLVDGIYTFDDEYNLKQKELEATMIQKKDAQMSVLR